MIIDTFIFFNELDILEIRLRELDKVVDHFVLVENIETFAGASKPLFFDESKRRFEKYLPKITHIKLGGMPPLGDDTELSRFRLEAFQRNAVMVGLDELSPADEDFILLSDVDEIPESSKVIEASVDSRESEFWTFRQTAYYHYFDSEVEAWIEEVRHDWLGTVGARYSSFKTDVPHAIRSDFGGAAHFLSPGETCRGNRRLVDRGGWHFTYFGGKKANKYKMVNFSHGAEDRFGKASSVAPSAINIGEATGLSPFDEALEMKIRGFLNHSPHGPLPCSVVDNLKDYYHHFKMSFVE